MNDYLAQVEFISSKERYARLRIGRGQLICRLAPELVHGNKVQLHVRPDSVLLSVYKPLQISARNVLTGKIKKLRKVPEGVYVDVDVGFPLSALVTSNAVRELALRKDKHVVAIIKAVSVELKAKVAPKVRVSLQGRKGRVEERHIDLLRVIEKEGSLSQAAKNLRVTYRSVWLWAEGMNNAWGKPLLQMAHGGKGGGGAWLTPEGKAVLAYAGRVEGVR